MGERALALYAPRSAVEHFTRAIDAAAHIGRAAEPTVFRGRGAAFDSLGDFDAARADYETALAAARSLHAPGEEIEALLALGLLGAGHDYAKTGDDLRAVMDLARQTGAAAALARSLNRLGNWHGNAMRTFEAIRDHQEALAIFEKLGDTRGVAQTLDVLGMAHLIGGDQIAGAAAYRRAIPLLRAVGDRQTLVSSLTFLSRGFGSYPRRMMERVPGDLEESDRMAEETIERRARSAGAPEKRLRSVSTPVRSATGNRGWRSRGRGRVCGSPRRSVTANGRSSGG